jgi:hypothetical protein
VTADEDRALRVVGVGRAEKADDVHRVDVVDRRERDGHTDRGRHVEPGQRRARIASARTNEVLRGRDRFSGGREQLVCDFLADHERRHGHALQARDVRVPKRCHADDEHADRPFLVRVLD